MSRGQHLTEFDAPRVTATSDTRAVRQRDSLNSERHLWHCSHVATK